MFFFVLFLSLHKIYLLIVIITDLPLVAGISSGQMEYCV